MYLKISMVCDWRGVVFSFINETWKLIWWLNFQYLVVDIHTRFPDSILYVIYFSASALLTILTLSIAKEYNGNLQRLVPITSE